MNHIRHTRLDDDGWVYRLENNFIKCFGDGGGRRDVRVAHSLHNRSLLPSNRNTLAANSARNENSLVSNFE